MARVVLVSSGGATMPGDRRAGVSLHQLGSVHREFERWGWAVDVASPHGGDVLVEPGTRGSETGGSLALTRGTTRLDAIAPDDVDVWFVLGGHGALVDLAGDAVLHERLLAAAVSGRTVAALDHGSAALAGIVGADGVPHVTGRAVTGRTDREERLAGHLEVLPRSTERLLRAAGGRFSGRRPSMPNVVEDGPFVTGQNPSSTEATVSAVLTRFRTRLSAA